MVLKKVNNTVCRYCILLATLTFDSLLVTRLSVSIHFVEKKILMKLCNTKPEVTLTVNFILNFLYLFRHILFCSIFFVLVLFYVACVKKEMNPSNFDINRLLCLCQALRRLFTRVARGSRSPVVYIYRFSFVFFL